MGRSTERGSQEVIRDIGEDKETQEGDTSCREEAEEGSEDRLLQEEVVMRDARNLGKSERGSLEIIRCYSEDSSPQYPTGMQLEDGAALGLTRSYTDEEKYWGKGNCDSCPREVTSGNGGCDGEKHSQEVVSDYNWHISNGSHSNGQIIHQESNNYRKEGSGQQDLISELQYDSSVGGGGEKDQKEMYKERDEKDQGEMHVLDRCQLDKQILQKRQRKSKSSKEKKRGRVSGGRIDVGQGAGHQRMEESGFQDLYRGHSVEEEDIPQDTGDGCSEGNSQCVLNSCRTEVTNLKISKEGLRERGEINGNKGEQVGTEMRGSKEVLFVPKEKNDLEVVKSYREEIPESRKNHKGCSECYVSYREEFRSPGNGSSGSGEGNEMDQGAKSRCYMEVLYTAC
ncbi:uncharacterized protein LOC142103590 [Mixophyes fleayi]|uniref:uncharacterized protein LOC142103590 n=1 Tax=Mixophyes fleayi TaxID=3061075 RepID=UPI003F4E168B